MNSDGSVGCLTTGESIPTDDGKNNIITDHRNEIQTKI